MNSVFTRKNTPCLTEKLSVHKLLLLAGVAAIALPGTQVLAQETQKKGEAETAQETVTLEPISVNAKADVLTGGVQITEEVLNRVNPQDIKDVFRQEPGVTVSSPTPIGQKVYVNGIEDTKLAVDIDGARQVTKTFHHIGTAIIDPELLKAVKVETGVAPADAGPEALGGSITYETKDGRDFLDAGETFGGYGKLSFNTNTRGFSENLVFAVQHEGFDGLAFISNDSGDNYTDGDGDEVVGTKPSLQSGMIKLGYTSARGYRVKVNANITRDRGIRPARPNFGGSSVTTDAPGLVDYERRSVTLSFGDETPTAMWDPKISISYTDTSLFADITNTPPPVRAAIISDITTINGKASNTFTVDLGKITTGVDFYVDRGKGGPEGNSNYKETVYDIGAFAQARLSLSEKARVSFGGRFDYNHLEGNEGSTFDTVGVSGNLNGEYDITDWFMGYAGIGSAWGGIPMTEIGVQNYWSAFGVTWNYDNLQPSRSYNAKIGGVIEAGNFTFDGNLYYTKIDDSHDVSSNNRGDQFDVISKGINASARYTFENGFIRASYTHSDVEVDGNVPTSTVAYQGIVIGDLLSVEAGYEWFDLGIRAGVTAEAALENDDPQKNGADKLDGYVVAGLYAEWFPEFLPDASLRLDVRNLLDADYTDRANVGYDSSRYVPYSDPGRSFVITAKYHF